MAFNSGISEPVEIEAGVFQWRFNTGRTSTRSFLQYDLATNNPNLEVGKSYRIEYLVSVQTGSYTACLTLTGGSGLTTLNNNRTATGTPTLCFYEFTIDSAGYAGEFRFGAGTTANNTNEVWVSNPRLFEI